MPYQDLAFNSATTNGSQLSSTQTGLANTSLSNTGTTNIGGSVTGIDVSAGGVPQIGGGQNSGGSFFKNSDGSFNSNNIGMIFGGLQSLGSLWNSYQQQKIAKEQIGLQREAFRTNLANNTQTYNTALEDRIRARASYSGQSEADTQSYLDKNKL